MLNGERAASARACASLTTSNGGAIASAIGTWS